MIPVSPAATAGLRVSSSVVASPLANATPLTVVAWSVPATANRPGSGTEAVSSAASKARLSVAPLTVAVCTAGGVLLVTASPVNWATRFPEWSWSPASPSIGV